MVSVVNGYLCYSSCDAKKAAHGKNPHEQPNKPESSNDANKASGFSGQPATILDGSLKALLAATAVSPVNSTADTSSTDINRPQINLLA